MRSAIISKKALFRLSTDSSNSRSFFRFFSDQGRVLSDEKRAAENVNIKKMEEEKLEKQSSAWDWAEVAEVLKKADKEKADQNKP